MFKKKLVESCSVVAFALMLCVGGMNSSVEEETQVAVACEEVSVADDTEEEFDGTINVAPLDVDIVSTPFEVVNEDYEAPEFIEEDDEEPYVDTRTEEEIVAETVVFEDELSKKELKKLETLDLEFEGMDADYYSKDSSSIYAMPSDDSESLGNIKKGDKVKVTGKTSTWYRVSYKDVDAFVSKSDLQKDKPEEESVKHKDIKYNYDGSKLTRSKGVNYGPSGKETYYNLNMSGVVRMMRGRGFSASKYPYWVREDGVKMLGDYVMVAANLSVHPRGTTVPTSLGTGLVCDTGGFAKHNSHQLDIATSW